MSAANHRRIAALASDRAVHRAFGWLHLHEAQMRRWQMEFLGIPAPPFGETERAAWFCERFREIGLTGATVDAAGNAVAELRTERAKDGGQVVMLSAHLDTVFPAGTDCTPHEEDAKILGPGACDNGAGLAALLGLAAALRHAEVLPGCTILFAANVGEEGEGDLRGMRHLFAEAPYAGRVRAAIALEGSGDAMVVDRALGSRRLRVTIAGPGGHSWADAGRANPIMTLAAALVEMGRLRLLARPRTTLNCGVIHGGDVGEFDSAVGGSGPGFAVSVGDGAGPHRIGRAGDADPCGGCGESAARGEDAEAACEANRRSGGGELAASSWLATSLKAVDRHLGISTEARIGSTDANVPLSLGVPALAIGAGGVGWGIHTLQEGYDPTGRDLALRRVLLLLLDMCALTAESGSELAEVQAEIHSGS